MTDHDERDDYDDQPWRRRATPEQLLRVPAAVIEICAAVQVVFSLLGCLAPAVFLIWDLVDPNGPEAMSWDEAILVTLAFGLCLAWNLVVIRGVGQMRRCQSYRAALAAAVMSILPLPFLWLGAVSIPAGIWVVAILGRRDVRARFAAVAHGRMNGEIPGVPNARRTDAF
jgi:hypothetical protein